MSGFMEKLSCAKIEISGRKNKFPGEISGRNTGISWRKKLAVL